MSINVNATTIFDANKQLQKLVEDISIQYFNKPFKHKATFNRRLKTTGGRYHLKDHNLDFNVGYANNDKVLIGIIKHELVHYHLNMAGYSGKHNTIEFKQLLEQVGGLRYAPTVKSNYKYVYKCKDCNQKYLRHKKLNVYRYVCSKCRGQLELVKNN